MIKSRVGSIENIPVAEDILHFSGFPGNIQHRKPAGQVLTVGHQGKLHIGIRNPGDRYNGYHIIIHKSLDTGTPSGSVVNTYELSGGHAKGIAVAASLKINRYQGSTAIGQLFERRDEFPSTACTFPAGIGSVPAISGRAAPCIPELYGH